MAALPPMQELFCQEYLVDLNATQAAARAGYAHPDVQGPRLLGNVRVAARIAELQEIRGRRLEMSADAVLKRLWAIATADPNELIEYRRVCCLKCHDGEYDAKRQVNPKCKECHGDGDGQAIAKDTRKLSPAARALYAGVKVTKAGLEIKMHDQMAALRDCGKHLGLFKDRDGDGDGRPATIIKMYGAPQQNAADNASTAPPTVPS